MTDIAQKASVRMTIMFPFWSELFFSMTINEVMPDDELAAQVQTAATDGRSLWINSVFFRALALEEQVKVLIHELGHKMFLHCTRRGGREAEPWNVACDYAINNLMKQNGFKLNESWLQDDKYNGWLAETIYADLKKEEKKEGGKPAKMPAGQSDLKEPTGAAGTPASPEEIEKIEEECKAVVDRAVQNGKAYGNLPAGVEQGVVSAFKASSEPWYNRLHRFMQDMASSNYNWARLNRRTLKSHGIFSPLHQSEALGDVCIWIDTSGSCYDKAQQAGFCNHINAIMAEAQPKRVIMYYFDTSVYEGEVFERGDCDIRLNPKGGGGTDFRRLFEKAEQDGYSPAVGIVLTDLMGPFGEEPDFPVIWASVVQGEAPFGETLYVE